MIEEEAEQLGPRAQVQLGIKMLAMILHRAAADAERTGNGLGIQPLQQQSRHLALAAGEARPPHAGDGLLHGRLEIGATRQCRTLCQQGGFLPPVLAAQRMHQRKQRLQPSQLVTAEGAALVEAPQKQHQGEAAAHRQDQPHLLLPAGGLIEVVAILGVEPPARHLRQCPDPGPQTLFQRLHKGILTEVAGEVAIEQQGPLVMQVVVEVDGALPHPEQQGAVERHLLLDQAHQRRRKGTAVQGIDYLGHAAGQGFCGEGLDHGC